LPDCSFEFKLGLPGDLLYEKPHDCNLLKPNCSRFTRLPGMRQAFSMLRHNSIRKV